MRKIKTGSTIGGYLLLFGVKQENKSYKWIAQNLVTKTVEYLPEQYFERYLSEKD